MDGTVKQKSFSFAVRIVKLTEFLRENKKEQVMSKQLLRCGTSIGANVAEAQQAQSKPDFISKLNIALKESAEADYWLCLLHETGYLSKQQFSSIISDCREVEKMLVSIVKSAKNN